MSEDPKTKTTRKIRRLIVVNPGSDSGDSDEGRQSRSRSKLSYPSAQPTSYTPPSVQHHPTPSLTTDLNIVARPSLSSPSSTSSPRASESTPPPSTPGLPGPPVDFPGDGHPILDSSIASWSHERNGSDGSHFTTVRPSQYSKLNLSKFSSPSESTQKQPSTILVTADLERYVIVEITGAKNSAFIRERIFSKLNIYEEEEQQHFSIYQTEIGAAAIGEPLSDSRLFELCRDHGDSRGTLKFLVSNTSAPVHEHPVRANHQPISVNTIPPPVVPLPPLPLHESPRGRRSGSRRDSISSTSEHQQLEATGYDADLENPVRGVPSSARYDSQQNLTPLSSSSARNPQSLSNGRRSSGPPRPSSPLVRPPHTDGLPSTHLERPRAQTAGEATLIDRHGKQVPAPPPPPPLSPSRATFSLTDKGLSPPTARPNHFRSGSDITLDREQSTNSPEQDDKPRQWRPRPLATDRRPPDSSGWRRQKRQQSDAEDSTADSWVMVSPSSSRNENEASSTPQDARTSPSATRGARLPASPSRHKGPFNYGPRALAIPSAPRQAPPAVPSATADSRAPNPQRPAGVPVPSVFVTWKGEGRGDQKVSSKPTRGLGKNVKSMENLRASPNSRRQNPPFPLRNSREQPPLPAGAAGLPKSYDSPRHHIRPSLPMPGSSGTNIHESGSSSSLLSRNPAYSGGLGSPNSFEPYPRPQSAFGDSLTAPVTKISRPAQSPIYGSHLDFSEPLRPSLPISPNLPISNISTSFSLRQMGNNQNDGERATMPNPHGPGSPSSPRNPTYERRVANHESSSYQNETLPPHSPESSRSSEGTLRQEDSLRLLGMIGEDSGTLIPSRLQRESSSNTHTTTEGSPSSTFIPDSQYGDSDSGGDDDGTSTLWQKRPGAERPISILRRPSLKVQTEAKETDSKDTTPRSNHPTFATPPTASTLRKPTNRIIAGPGVRGSTFTDMRDYNWAPRPPPEDVYERLEEFFPEHDLDRPVIEASSGGTSPTTGDQQTVLAPPVAMTDKTRIRSKKSIRIVAEEHKKRIGRLSRAESTTYSNVARKRSTRFWDAKVEEVTPAQAKAQNSIPESPLSGPAPLKWVRGELIGRGTYGKVYLALNATTGEMIAVKQVETPRSLSDKNDSRQVTVVQALKLEIETLKDLDHPNIVQYLGFEETPANLSIFLEYVPGGSVGSCLLKHGKFNEDVTKSFTAQILGGLEYLHSRGILHRDMKADNILVEMSGICKISDFGISKRTDDSDGGAYTAMQGTVFWMAPEVINSQKKGYNNKIDIWSIGCVVLEMWAGMRPWNGDEMVAVMFKLYQSKLPPPVPADVFLSDLAEDFRKKCFAINPEERPTAAELRKHPYLTLPPDWVFTSFT